MLIRPEEEEEEEEEGRIKVVDRAGVVMEEEVILEVVAAMMIGTAIPGVVVDGVVEVGEATTGMREVMMIAAEKGGLEMIAQGRHRLRVIEVVGAGPDRRRLTETMAVAGETTAVAGKPRRSVT